MDNYIFSKVALAIAVVVTVSCRTGPNEPNGSTPTTDDSDREKPKAAANMAHVISKDGTTIAYEKSGSGLAVIIISGALSARSLFDGEPMSLIDKLSKHFTVYAYDRRGRGESTDVQPYAVAHEIEDIEALIDNAGGKAYLYGVSSGGALALQAAAKLGSAKVPKLAIFEPPYGQEKQAFEKQKQGVNDRVKNGEPGDAAAFFLSSIGTPPDALEKIKSSPAWETMKKIDFTLVYDYQVLGDGAIPRDIVKAITVPTLVMDGEKSLDFMHATAEQIAKLAAGGQRVMLKGQMHQAKAEVVTPQLVDFFNGSTPQ